MKLMTPDGNEIVGTLERMAGCAGIMNEDVTKNADGTYEFDWDGETKIYWDEQRTKERDGQRIFMDEYGNEWLENQLVLVEEDVTSLEEEA